MKGRLLSHRGCWIKGYAKNSLEALKRSFEHGYGVETDIRDQNGEIVISHDMPVGPCLSLAEVLTCAAEYAQHTPVSLALNVKSDGLARMVEREITRHPCLDCFVFDMSVPDMRSHLKAGLKTFTRVSDVEQNPVLFESCDGVWLDSFEAEWYSNELISNFLSKGKRVCIVSPELHGRPYLELWTQLTQIWDAPGLMLCTDLPDEAHAFFSEVTL